MLAATALLLTLQGDDVDFGPARTAGGASVRLLKLPAAHTFRAVDVFFSRDGESLYFGEPGGRVRRYSTSGLKVLASTRIPAGLGGIGLSRAGVVALNPLQSQLKILDPATLGERHSHPVRNVDFFTTGPDLDIAFITQPEFMLATIDLESGRITREHHSGKLNRDFARRVTKPEGEFVALSWGGLKNAHVSHDGRYLFCATDQHLHRLALSGPDLLWEETAIYRGWTMQLSPDSRLVLVPGGRRMPSMALSASDLSRKEFTISEEHGIVGLATDASGAKLFAAEGDGTGKVASVAIFDTRGARTAGVEIADAGRIRGRLAAHPAGKAVAIPLEDGVIWVEWK